jgi:hypothetical protein
MKKSTVATLAIVLVITGSIINGSIISGSALAQDKMAATQSEHATAFSPKPLTVSGKVSQDGKTFLTDIDSEWSVANADALKGYEGHVVRVKCYVDTEKSSIKVLSVKREGSESNYAARNTDSAFRR